ncbi:Cell division protein FtsQ [Rubellimicrobium mesophilum DSM 19309]|uniref:Cell division protein FtsQ n=1 Tax=Rubellimicrobium mesophilum DSM 19309 TaxID=442562 RepID=A0A017HN71_9RHOB|nr:cell division protein FtsQ/DivIB [Rubellimicrobium mesophilum]EYD75234.1 Cell division protein FtsQ [Rubellimicrobium mesophilum DSM 19309]
MRTLKLLWQLTIPSLVRQPAQPSLGLRRDPAPSVWSYRYQRLMLTPFYRRLVKVGLPVGAVLAVAALWLASDDHRALVAAKYDAMMDAVRERPEFMVTAVEIAGADRALTAAINEVARIDLPVSSFDLDLDALRRKVTDLTAVRSAQVKVNPGGTLEIAVVQRVPVAVWRYADGLRLIDGEGVMTGMIAERADRSDLPLIAGDGAKDAIDESLRLFSAAAPIAPRVRGLVRMGERRWDMILDNDLRILLPTHDPVPALERVIALDQAQQILDRDVGVVDMRLGDRPTLRLNPVAAASLREAIAANETVSVAPIQEDH